MLFSDKMNSKLEYNLKYFKSPSHVMEVQVTPKTTNVGILLSRILNLFNYLVMI